MNKPASTATRARPRPTLVAQAASRLASTGALLQLAGVLGLALLFDPVALAQTTQPALPVRSADGLLSGVKAPVTNGASMSITQDAQRAIIDWTSFNIGQGATVSVNQPAATSILLNRVVAGSVDAGPSTINGNLLANGRVFILDPNGVVLGSTARVNVGGLLAAAMTMSSSDADFVAGNGLTLNGDATRARAVQVEPGAVIAGPSAAAGLPAGDVVLLGASNVDFNGRITAGNVFIGAGGAAQVPVGDSGFVKLQLTRGNATAGGAPTLTAGTSSDVVVSRGGSVTIATAGSGEATVSWAGNIDATGGSIDISGTAVNGTAVSLANLTLAGDSIRVRGVAGPGVAPTVPSDLPTTTVGVDVAAVQVNLGATGRLSVAGRADAGSNGRANAYGLRLNRLSVSTPDAGGTKVTLAGQGLGGSSNAGIVTGNGGGSGLFSLFGQNLNSAADVVMGGSAGQNGHALWSVPATGAPAGLPSAPFIRTDGKVNLRPLGVDVNGAIVELRDMAIQLGGRTGTFTTPFVVPADWLADGSLDSIGNIITSGLVIGSAGHRGRIGVDADALAGDTLPLTLHNRGLGSAGVGFEGNRSTVPQLTVLSAGPVDQTGALRVGRLLLQGDGANAVTLDNAANEIGSLGFDQVGKLDVVSHALVSGAPVALSLETAPLAGYDADLDRFTAFTPTGNSATQSVLVRSDVLRLDSSVATSGPGSTIDLVAGTRFESPGAATLSTGTGGVWRVWSPNWDTQLGALAGNDPVPVMFGCVFGDTTVCSLSQVALPSGRNGLFFSDRPTLTISPESVSAPRGRALPALPYSVSGLVFGHTPAEALSGALGTTATPVSPEGVYPILPGSLASPLGYRVVLGAGSTTNTTPLLTLTAAVDLPRPPLDVSMSHLMFTTSSETYGRNLALPSLCLAPGAARRDRAGGDSVDLLGLEWGRVRLQPQLSSCVDVSTDPSCSPF